MSHLDHFNDGHKLIITELPSDTGERGAYVEAHLPETYGLSTGSEISTPFSSYVTGGVTGKALAAIGVSTATGVKTRKMFTGSTNPDINVELKFEAFYSAYSEVIKPVKALMLMSVGVAEPVPEPIVNIVEKAGRVAATGAKGLGAEDADAPSKEKIRQSLHYFKSSPYVRCAFGKSFVIEKAYISSINVRFGRDLDYDYSPLSADVTLTITPVTPLDRDRVKKLFGEV